LAAKLLRFGQLRLCSLMDLSSELQVPPLGVSVGLVHAAWGSDLTLDLCAARVGADSLLPFARLTVATVACQHQTVASGGCRCAM